MGKFINGIVVIVVILYFTCPTEEDHQKAVDDKVSEFFEKGLSENPDSALGAALSMGILGAVANEVGIRPFGVRDYKNWWIFSTAKIENDTTLGILDHVFIIDKSSKKTQAARPQSESLEKASKYRGKRKYICEFIDKQGGCRIVTMTKNGADVAISNESNWAYCNGCPSGLAKAVKEIDEKGCKINDVCLTETGKWIVVYGRNGYRSEDIPPEMANALRKYNENNEELCCASLNDEENWVVVTDKHYSASSTELMNWLEEKSGKYGELVYVSLTDEAQVAVFDGGYAVRGKYPKDMWDALSKAGFSVRVVKMAGDSWFFADETGRRYRYSM